MRPRFAWIALTAAGAAAQGSLPQLLDAPARGPFRADVWLREGAVLGDVDGDGDLDVVGGHAADASTMLQSVLLRNQGRGSFADPVVLLDLSGQTPGLRHGLGDLDGDGDLDLVIATQGGAPHALLRNDGTGGFVPAPGRIPWAGDATLAVALGDLDQDGDQDLVLGNDAALGPQKRLLLNDGRGTFRDLTSTHLPRDRHRTSSLALADFDGDGDLDLAVGNRYGVDGRDRLYANDGTGRFADVSAGALPGIDEDTLALAAGDLEGDGDLDLFAADLTDRVYRNDGTGRFIATVLPSGPHAAVALADLDGDGDLDALGAAAVVAAEPGRITLLRNDRAAGFTDLTARLPGTGGAAGTFAVSAGDTDGDADPDLIVATLPAGQNAGTRLWVNDGAGSFQDPAPLLPYVLAPTNAIAAGDLDADGDQDLVLGTGSYSLGDLARLHLGDGRGGFVAASAMLPAQDDHITSVALGDVDRDGDLDVVAGAGLKTIKSGSVGGLSRLWINDGRARFTDGSGGLPQAVAPTAALRLGDVDGDRDQDIVLAQGAAGNALWVNDGLGFYTDVTLGRLPPDNDTAALALLDVDLDQDLDLVLGRGSAGLPAPCRLLRNDGSGRFSDASSQLPQVPGVTAAIAAGDVDRDGDPDLVLGQSGQPKRLYLNDGRGTFADLTVLLPADAAVCTEVTLVDLDLDGALDLLFAAYPVPRMWRNNGAGAFTDVTGARLRLPFATAWAVADVDLDGDPDLVLPDRVAVDLARHVRASATAWAGQAWTLDVYADPFAATAQLALPCLSGGQAALPLPPLGLLRLDPTQLIAGPVLSLPPGSAGAWTLPLPLAVAGATLHAQALVGSGPVVSAWRLTNAVAERVW